MVFGCRSIQDLLGLECRVLGNKLTKWADQHYTSSMPLPSRNNMETNKGPFKNYCGFRSLHIGIGCSGKGTRTKFFAVEEPKLSYHILGI